MKDIDLAWAAGLIDGEGSIFTSNRSRRPNCTQLFLAIQMTEKAPVKRFADLFGMSCRKVGKTSTGKQIWATQTAAAQKVKDIFVLLEPYLSEHKLKQGREAIKRREKYISTSKLHPRGERGVALPYE